MSNRTIRRAAERAALKAARKAERQTTANSAVTATGFNHPSEDSNPLFQPRAEPENGRTTFQSNVQTSTGPRTEAGKEIASRNALKHGMCAIKTLILPTESRSDYMTLEANWFQTYRADPFDKKDPIKSELIRTAARADWFFKRAERNYSDVEAKLMTETPDMVDWSEEQHKKLSRALRYRTANANILARHRKDLEAHIKARAAESAHYQKMRDNDQRMNIARERLKIFSQKNKPFDLAEELEAMKQKAIRLGFRQPDPPSASA